MKPNVKQYLKESAQILAGVLGFVVYALMLAWVMIDVFDVVNLGPVATILVFVSVVFAPAWIVGLIIQLCKKDSE